MSIFRRRVGISTIFGAGKNASSVNSDAPVTVTPLEQFQNSLTKSKCPIYFHGVEYDRKESLPFCKFVACATLCPEKDIRDLLNDDVYGDT